MYYLQPMGGSVTQELYGVMGVGAMMFVAPRLSLVDACGWLISG
jgi:hypothetical protein